MAASDLWDSPIDVAIHLGLKSFKTLERPSQKTIERLSLKTLERPS